MEEKRVRKKSKRLSESSSLYDDEEPPQKRAKRTKSVTKDESQSSKKQSRTRHSKKLVVSFDFSNTSPLTLGGVPLSQVSSGRIKPGQRSRRSESLASSRGNSVQDEIITNKPEKVNFKNPKFCFSYLAGNKKKTWKNFKQIMTAEKSLSWGPDDPRYSSLDAPPLLKPARKYSDLSGLLAKYTDPLTGLYYSSTEEFQLIRTLPSDIVQSYLALRGKMTIT